MGRLAEIFSEGAIRGAVDLSTFVSVGNATQPFIRLLAAVDAVAQELPQPVIVQAGSASFHSDRCSVCAFTSMSRFEELVRESELLILHAGAGSVMHAIAARKVPVVMARRAALGEHVDDHQVELAHELEQAGRVVVAEDGDGLLAACLGALAAQRRLSAEARVPNLVALVAAVLSDYAQRNAKQK